MPGIGVSSPSSPGVGIGVGGSTGAELGPNPNLLLWTEAFDHAAWVRTSLAVAADFTTGPTGTATADNLTSSSPTAAIRQVSTTAASAGAAATANVNAMATWTRYSVTGSYDGLDYTFSVYMKDASGGGIPTLRLRLDRSGGFLRCSIEDTGDELPYCAWGAQLEQASAPSAYQGREGA